LVVEATIIVIVIVDISLEGLLLLLLLLPEHSWTLNISIVPPFRPHKLDDQTS